MFILLFDRRHRVLLARLGHTFGSATITALVSAGERFVAREGPVRTVVDFSDVEDVTVPTSAMVDRGMQPPVMADQERIFVMPRADLFGLGRLFGTYQRISGSREPLIVRTIDEAYAKLGLVEPDFQPVAED